MQKRRREMGPIDRAPWIGAAHVDGAKMTRWTMCRRGAVGNCERDLAVIFEKKETLFVENSRDLEEGDLVVSKPSRSRQPRDLEMMSRTQKKNMKSLGISRDLSGSFEIS